MAALLLDTHAAVWALLGTARLSTNARAAIEAADNVVHVSVASIWEIAIKAGSGKWPEAEPVLSAIEAHLSRLQFQLLSINISHVRTAGLMQSPHRDPFDRLLAAQAQIEGLTLVSADPKVQTLATDWLW
jgi:PIN domain nuclease of toxin-antitoxin system